MKESGTKTSSMEKELKPELMEQSTMVNSYKELNLARATSTIRMDHPTREIFLTVSHTDMVCINGVMIAFMRVNGMKVRCMVMEQQHGQMVDNT